MKMYINSFLKKWSSTIWAVILLFLFFFLWLYIFIGQAIAQNSNVPNEYYTNYQVANDFEEMNDVLSTLDALIKVGQEPTTDLFLTLSDNFKVVFDFFPKSRPNAQVYKQCDLLVWELAQGYSVQTYTSFKKLCFDSVKDIVKKIASTNTVKANIVVKPNQWPWPLNVTLDARWSTDPSDDTIPEDNYFRYYKNIDAVDTPIWRGPVMNYTFDEPWRYVVHLTVRSANNEELWVFDGEDTVEIVVSPRTADIVVYLNWKLLDNQSVIKIGTQDAQDWFNIDWTATTPLWWRTIVEHTRKITWDEQTNRFSFEKTEKWPPSQFNSVFPYNGIYTLQLETQDNESNKVKEEFKISVSDPVSLIKYSPKKWDTKTDYKFDASASYSLTSRISKYQRSIVDPDGNQIETFESRELMRSFKLPGMYTVKLTVFDDLKNSSYDVQKIYVESSSPVPSFIAEPISDWNFPSQFVLDASGSKDVDVSNGVDSLTYHRSFSRPDAVEITSNMDNGKRVLISFNETWKHVVTLEVKDSYGKSVSIEKTFDVVSTLRPELLISPVTSKRGDEVTLISRSNKEIWLHTWDLGDGATQTTEVPKIKHIYDQAGIYNVELHVATPNGLEENTITRRVFVGQKDSPSIHYQVKSSTSEYLQQDGRCSVDGVDMPAFVVDRYEKVNVSIADSIWVQWKKSNLQYYLQTQPEDNGTIYEKSQTSHSFNELWCHSILASVEDSEVGKTAQELIRFNVENALPIIDNLLISFPQSQSNQWLGIGIWLQQPKETQDLFSISKFDPLLVRVSASWVRDPDANQISRFVRYFYNTASPEDLIDVKVTPASVPFASFSVQRIPGEYAFGVRIIDSDDGQTDSTESLWKWPVIFFPASDTNPDFPLVSLSVSSRTVQVGEEVVFSPTSSVLSNRSDFDSSRYYRYDVDWDWKNDSGKIKSDTFTHVYDKPGTYKPSVSVVYRDKLWRWFSGEIIVKQWVKPQFIYDSYWLYSMFLNTSIGQVEDQVFCADINNCGESSSYRIDQFDDPEKRIHLIKYPKSWIYESRLISNDEYWNKLPAYETDINIQDVNENLWLLSIPDAQEVWSWFNITVWSNLDNTLYLYVAFEWEWNCFVDLNTSIDANNDGDPIYDRDVNCNELYTYTFDDFTSKQVWRIHYAVDGKAYSKRLNVSFLDVDVFEEELAGRLIGPASALDWLIDEVERWEVVDQEGYYIDLLNNLRSSLSIQQERISLLDQLYQYTKQSNIVLPSVHRQNLEMLFIALEDQSNQPVFAWNIYEQTKSTVLNTYFRDKVAVREEFVELFKEFEKVNGDKVMMKEVLDTVYTRLWELANQWIIDEIDLNDIKKSLCNTIVYYELESKTCGVSIAQLDKDTQNEEEASVPKDSDSWWINKILKRVLIWIWIILVIVVMLLVLFALKAKNQQKESEE